MSNEDGINLKEINNRMGYFLKSYRYLSIQVFRDMVENLINSYLIHKKTTVLNCEEIASSIIKQFIYLDFARLYPYDKTKKVQADIPQIIYDISLGCFNSSMLDKEILLLQMFHCYFYNVIGKNYKVYRHKDICFRKMARIERSKNDPEKCSRKINLLFISGNKAYITVVLPYPSKKILEEDEYSSLFLKYYEIIYSWYNYNQNVYAMQNKTRDLIKNLPDYSRNRNDLVSIYQQMQVEKYRYIFILPNANLYHRFMRCQLEDKDSCLKNMECYFSFPVFSKDKGERKFELLKNTIS